MYNGMSLVVISTIFITCNQMSSPNGMTILPLSCLETSLSAFALSRDGGILLEHQKFKTLLTTRKRHDTNTQQATRKQSLLD